MGLFSKPKPTPEARVYRQAYHPQYRIIKNGLGEYYVELSWSEEEWKNCYEETFTSLEDAQKQVVESQEANRKWREQLALARQTEVVDGPHDY